MKGKEAKTYPEGDWGFTADGGKTYHEGKAHWPALLRLKLDNAEARDLLCRLASYFQSKRDDVLTLHFSGKLERLDEP